MIWILPILFIFFALAVIGWMILRKLPQLRVLDVSRMPKEHERKLKEQLLLQKIQRLGGGKYSRVSKYLTTLFTLASKQGRRLVQRLYRIEQSYQKLRRAAAEGQHAYDEETIKRLIDQAQDFIRDDEFFQPEKMYIDIISHNPKNVDAYEALGNLYLKTKEYPQARETLRFALKLSPTDASIFVSLAELESEQGNSKASLEFLRKAVTKRPKNPKYLDFYIEAALKAGSLKDARKGIQLLKEVNPENKKLEDFEKRFQELKQEYINKTDSSQEN